VVGLETTVVSPENDVVESKTSMDQKNFNLFFWFIEVLDSVFSRTMSFSGLTTGL